MIYTLILTSFVRKTFCLQNTLIFSTPMSRGTAARGSADGNTPYTKGDDVINTFESDSDYLNG